MKLKFQYKGSSTSGDFGHRGRPGKIGGSAPRRDLGGQTFGSYDEYAVARGIGAKRRSGKFAGEKFSLNRHKYEVIQSIPPMRVGGKMRAYLHTYDETKMEEVLFYLNEDGTVERKGEVGGTKLVEQDFPIKYEDFVV